MSYSINMSALAKEVGGANWIRYMDTYGLINKSEILLEDKNGKDLYQVVGEGNTHICFEYRPRVIGTRQNNFLW